MRKKLICLILSMIMLLGVLLTSCAKDADDVADNMEEEASASAVTLSLYIMTENKLSEDTAAAMEKAISAITEERLKTRLKIYFYTEDEYYDKLEKAFADRKAAIADGSIIGSQSKETDENNDPVFNQTTGKIEIKYPSIRDDQVDIFYFSGKEKFDKYKREGLLSKLEDELSGTAALLTTNIPSQYLSNIKYLNSGTYAVPTNNVIGEYTYLLLNKNALVETYRRNENGPTDYSEYTSLTCDMVKSFLEDVASTDGTLADSYYPLYTNMDEEELLISNLRYWGIEDGELENVFSVLGGYYSDSYDYLDANAYAKIENLFENKQFINDLKTLKGYEFDGYYNEVEGKDFAVGYVKGGAELEELYGDEYEMIVLESPRLDGEALYSDLYAVSTYTTSLPRSMEVITLLNTDTTLRNMLLYGIEGEHYHLIDTEVENAYGERIMAVERFEAGNAYMLDVDKTGNVFVAYPTVDEAPTLKAYGVLQNQNAKVDLALGFSLKDVNTEKLTEVQTLSNTLLAEYLACTNEAELEAFITSAKQRVADSEAVKYHLDTANEDSISAVYRTWLEKNKIISK